MPNLSKIPALDVVIGLGFVYFVLSLVISSVTEAISAVFQVRWRKLERGLRELFLNSGGNAEQAKKLWNDFQKNDRNLPVLDPPGTGLAEPDPDFHIKLLVKSRTLANAPTSQDVTQRSLRIERPGHPRPVPIQALRILDGGGNRALAADRGRRGRTPPSEQ